MALVHADHTMDLDEVLQSIVKEYQVHWLVLLIVLLQDLGGNIAGFPFMGKYVHHIYSHDWSFVVM